MLPMIRKHAVITAALMATLTLSACGKKTEMFKSPDETTTEEGSDAARKGSQKGDLGGGLSDSEDNRPSDSTKSGNRDSLPPLPQPLPDVPPVMQEEEKTLPPPPAYLPLPAPENGTPTPPPAIVDTAPVTSNPASNPVPPSYNSKDARNVSDDGFGKRLTGGVAQDGLVYTSTSTDQLLDYLRARNERVSWETRQLNLKAAASVEFAQLQTDKMSGDALVTLKIREGNSVNTYRLGGGRGEGVSSNLRKLSAGTTGKRALDGTIKCLDLDGGCETTFVRLKIGSSPSSAIINIVFRQSFADLFFQLPGEYSQNPEYLNLRGFIRNSTSSRNTTDAIKHATMSSFEVVNGRSGVTVSVVGKNRELLAFAGPLLAPEAGTAVNLNLSRIAKDEEDSLDLLAQANNKLNYANTIGQARLIANNGLGQVKVALKMRKRAHYAQDQIAITFMRKINPIVDLTDENLR